MQQKQQSFRVSSYALAVYFIAAGFECREAVIEDGKPVYIFDPEATAVLPAFQTVKRKLDGIARTAGLAGPLNPAAR